MKINLPNAVTSRVAHSGLALSKHSPKMLFWGGLVLMGATIVSSSSATLRLGDVLDEIKEDRREVERKVQADDVNEYSERDVARMNLAVSLAGFAKVVRLYLPSVALGVAAVACLTSSHNQLTRRNAGLSAALAATERAMERYRSRIREEYGEEKELELWRDERTETRPVLDDEGRETKSTKKVKVGGGRSPYARIWGRDTSSEWNPEPAYNVAKLRVVQEWGTLRIAQKGHLFLNEIFDELGIERTPEGAVVGWIAQKYAPKDMKVDGFVDFGVLDPDEASRFLDFVTGAEDHVMLDFNVDGEIWRLI